MRFREKVVVVTGAARGIGLAAAQRFAREGAHLFANDWDTDALNEAVDALKSEGGSAFAILADASEEACVRMRVEEVISQCGHIDVLVNNAGIMMRKPADILTSQEWRRAMSINLDGYFYWSSAVACESMIPRRSGVIVNVASIAGLVGRFPS